MSPSRLAKLELGIRAVLAFNKAFNQHDVDGMIHLMSENCVFENTTPPPDGTRYSGKEAILQFWRDFFRELPDMHMDIEEVFGLGNRCILRWRHEWMDAAGHKVHVRGIDLFKIEEGLISEHLSYVKGS